MIYIGVTLKDVKSTPFGTRTSKNSSIDALTWLLFGMWMHPWEAPLPPCRNNAIEVRVLKSQVLLLFTLSCPTFATPWTAARQAALSFTVSRSLLKLMSVVTTIFVTTSCPLWPLSCPQSFPASGSFPMSGSLYQSLHPSFSIGFGGGLHTPFQCGIAFSQGLWWLNLKKWREMKVSDARVSQEESNCEQKVQQPSVLQIIPWRLSLFCQVYSVLILKCLGTSLVAHWLRPSAPKVGAQVRSLFRELDPTWYN